MHRTLTLVLSVGLASSVAGCAGATPAPAPEAPAPEPASLPEPAGDELHDAGQLDAEAALPKEPPAPRRPLAIYENAAQLTTTGGDGAVFRLPGGVELRIPTNALKTPYNILLQPDKKAKGQKGKLGEVYLLELQVPNKEYFPGDVEASLECASFTGEPFIIKLPLPAGTTSASLAVESVSVDEKTKKPQYSWTVVPMTRSESYEAGYRAVFEFQSLPDGRLHLTSEAPGGS